jgi:hypothetical protein
MQNWNSQVVYRLYARQAYSIGVRGIDGASGWFKWSIKHYMSQ